MTQFQYMQLPIKPIIQEIKDYYDIDIIARNGHVHVEIRKGIYGIKVAGILTFNKLVTHLVPLGYHIVKHAPGIWMHETRYIMCNLAVDNFGIKYFHKRYVDHLLKYL